MQFMVMHKMTQGLEHAFPPDPAVVAAVGKLIEEGVKEKIFVSGEGLRPSRERLHLAYANGKRTITEGPFKDLGQLVAGFALLRVRSKDEAIGWVDKFAAVIGDVELFMGPVVEPWDLGVVPKPENPPLRFLCLHQANEHSERELDPDPALRTKMGALVEEMTKAGVLQATGGLAATSKGARIRFEGGKRTVVDGPFAESKELVAGYAIIEAPSTAAAVEWSKRFGEVVKVNEVEVRAFSH
jgi:hypothetical protein